MSLITVLLLLFNGWKGWEMVYQYRPLPLRIAVLPSRAPL
jgi:hypothetical protein